VADGNSAATGARLADGEGEALWQHCVDTTDLVMTRLEKADVSEASRQHILYAVCALLDETAKGRDGDDACIVWYDRPLEVKYFGTMTAGDMLYERMRQVLREPAPDPLVLTCFHRVLMLGFKGSVASLNDPLRERLFQELAGRVRHLTWNKAIRCWQTFRRAAGCVNGCGTGRYASACPPS
jgi:type VI secretion system protein ImpK